MRESVPISTTYDITRMMKSVHHWLNYMYKVSRIDMLAESSIIYPTMEYIERNTKAENCYMERSYDEFTSIEYANKKYVDLMWEGAEDVFLMEFKYVGLNTSSSEERQRYFNDVTRLGLALKYNKLKEKKMRCFFIVCGREDLFEDQLLGRKQNNLTGGNFLPKKRGRKPKINTEFDKWIAIDDSSKDDWRTISYNETNWSDLYLRFIAEYYLGKKDKKFNKNKQIEILSKYKDTFLPEFYTKRIKVLKEENSGGQVLGIWEVFLSKSDNNTSLNSSTNTREEIEIANN